MITRSCGVTLPQARLAAAAPRPALKAAAAAPRYQRRTVLARGADYAANAADDGVLQLPAKTELDASALKNVFGYDRDLQGQCVSMSRDVIACTS